MMGAYYVAVGISQYLGSIVANYASIPSGISDPMQSLPIYINLFNKLGLVGIGCTVIALAVLPMMRKLSNSHAQNDAALPLPAVHSEELA